MSFKSHSRGTYWFLSEGIRENLFYRVCLQFLSLRVSMLTSVHHRQRLQWARDRLNWTVNDWKKVDESDESLFCSTIWRVGYARVFYLEKCWHHYTLWTKTSWWRKCDGLNSVLLGNAGSCHSCRPEFDVFHLPEYRCRPGTFLHGNGILQWRYLFSTG